MEEYCEKIFEVLSDEKKSIHIFKCILQFIENLKTIDYDDRKVFEKKETTDILLGEIDNIIEFVDSHKISDWFECHKEESPGIALCYQVLNEIQKRSKGKLIIIDNADILLDDAMRSYIALDGNNQYIIIGRNPTGLLLNIDEVYELQNECVDGITLFTLKKSF